VCDPCVKRGRSSLMANDKIRATGRRQSPKDLSGPANSHSPRPETGAAAVKMETFSCGSKPWRPHKGGRKVVFLSKQPGNHGQPSQSTGRNTLQRQNPERRGQKKVPSCLREKIISLTVSWVGDCRKRVDPERENIPEIQFFWDWGWGCRFGRSPKKLGPELITVGKKHVLKTYRRKSTFLLRGPTYPATTQARLAEALIRRRAKCSVVGKGVCFGGDRKKTFGNPWRQGKRIIAPMDKVRLNGTPSGPRGNLEKKMVERRAGNDEERGNRKQHDKINCRRTNANELQKNASAEGE